MDDRATADIHIPKGWLAATKIILQKSKGNILVLGASDRGKSVYSRYLVTQLREHGVSVAFVDADIGQKDIGLPATISLAHLNNSMAWGKIKPDASYFVGAVSPMRHYLDMIVGTRAMFDLAQADFIINNTTGLVHGSGRILKSGQIESLRPDVIVTLEKERELDAIVNTHSHYRFLRLSPSPYAKTKYSKARKHTREQLFKSYFSRASLITLNITQLTIQRLPLFCGKPYEDPRFLYAEQLPDGISAVTRDQYPQKYHGVYTLPVDFERDLLCALANRRGVFLGLCIVKHIDYRKQSITLLTPVTKRQIKIVQFGDMYVTPDGKELHHGLYIGNSH